MTGRLHGSEARLDPFADHQQLAGRCEPNGAAADRTQRRAVEPAPVRRRAVANRTIGAAEKAREFAGALP